jgi:hypothetical protein
MDSRMAENVNTNSGNEIGILIDPNVVNEDGEPMSIALTRESNFMLWIPFQSKGFFSGVHIDSSVVNDLQILSTISKKMVIRFD